MSEDAAKFAKQYLEDMLAFFGLNLKVVATVDDDVIELAVPSSNMNGFLIGERGNNLRSFQHLVGLAMRAKGMDYRINIDIAEYKKQRAERLAEQVKQWVETVQKTGTAMELSSMNAADRRTVHKTAGEIENIETESVGEGRDRHVVIRKV